MDATQAAQALVKSFDNLPPQAHAVWIKTSVDNSGEFVRKLCVSWHPKLKDKPKLPLNFNGFDIELQPWPQDML